MFKGVVFRKKRLVFLRFRLHYFVYVMSSARGFLRLFLLCEGCTVGFSLFQVDSVVGGCRLRKSKILVFRSSFCCWLMSVVSVVSFVLRLFPVVLSFSVLFKI